MKHGGRIRISERAGGKSRKRKWGSLVWGMAFLALSLTAVPAAAGTLYYTSFEISYSGSNNFTDPHVYKEDGDVNWWFFSSDAIITGTNITGYGKADMRVAKGKMDRPVVQSDALTDASALVTGVHFKYVNKSSLALQVFVSTDGVTWQQIGSTLGYASKSAGTLVTIDGLNLRGTLYLRFEVSPAEATASNRDVLLDDVQVVGSMPDTYVKSPCPNLWSCSFTDAMTLTLSQADGKPIYYTTDESDPSLAGSKRYDGPLTIDTTTVICFAARDGDRWSGCVRCVYTSANNMRKPSVPAISGPSVFSDSALVRIGTADSGAIIRFTTDGTVPDAGAKLYEGPFWIYETTVVQAVAIVGAQVSDVATATFTKTDDEVATLPVVITDNYSDERTGVRTDGTGTYADAYKFDSQGDNIVIRYDGNATLLEFEISRNNLSNFTTGMEFEVSASADGLVWDQLNLFDATTQHGTYMVEMDSLPRYRFIRFMYDSKPSGSNVALSNIYLVECGNLTLRDDSVYVPVEKLSYSKVTLHKMLEVAWNVLCLPFDLTEAQLVQSFGENARVAKFVGVEGNKLLFSSADQNVEAHVPCLIKVSASGTEWNMGYVIERPGGVKAIPSADGTLEFVGSYAPVVSETGCYFLSGNRFCKSDAAFDIASETFGAFVRCLGGKAPDAFSLSVTDGTNGLEIPCTNFSKQGEPWYFNLGGQRFSTSGLIFPKGIFIRGGRKVMVR